MIRLSNKNTFKSILLANKISDTLKQDYRVIARPLIHRRIPISLNASIYGKGAPKMTALNSPFNLKTTQGFDLSHGFLPQRDPITHLPSELRVWDEFAYSLPKLLTSRRFRQFVKELPEFKIEALQTGEEYERAMVVLSFIAHAYIWLTQDKAAEVLPAVVAKPFCAVAKKLGRLPIQSYASYALYNWRRIDKKSPIEIDNICLLNNYLGGIDEEWFILIHVDIEQKAALGLSSLLPAQTAIKQNNLPALIKALTDLRTSLTQMQKTMERMLEHCDPYIYYNRVRPYIHGWKGNPALPDGLIYEGVTEYHNKPQQFKGETGAQSGIIPLFDATLKVSHIESPLKTHLNEMRFYMPPEHQEFLTELEKSPSIRDHIKQSGNAELKSLYNDCINLIAEFRTTHLKYAALYIEKQNQTSAANSNSVGTGGTPFMAYLRKHRDETNACLL